MHDLLIIIRNIAVHDSERGRLSLRAGALVNIEAATAARLVAGGYARHAIPPAPLFVDSTQAREETKKVETTKETKNVRISKRTLHPS